MLKGASLNAAPLFWTGMDGPGEKVLNSRSFWGILPALRRGGRGGAFRAQKKLRLTTKLFDVSDKIRTRDLLVRSQTLYPAELHLHNTSIL